MSINDTANLDFDLALSHLLKNDFDTEDITKIKITGELFEIQIYSVRIEEEMVSSLLDFFVESLNEKSSS